MVAGVYPGQQFAADCEALNFAIRKYATRIGFVLPNIHLDITLPDLSLFQVHLENHIAQLQAAQSDRRIQAWKRALRLDFKSGGRKTYAWLRNDWQAPLTAVQNSEGVIATSPNDVVESAVALDGRRVSEMKMLPKTILSLAADLYSDIENSGVWPQANCFACISCLPKTATAQPSFKDVADICAPQALNTRPISNISPWATTYSGIRFKQMSAWRESWLPNSMHGARCHHETSDVSYELQLQIEHSAMKKLALAGISLDRRKFFDLLQHEICFGTLLALGAPLCVI